MGKLREIELFTARIRLNCQNVLAFIYQDCLTIDLRDRQASSFWVCVRLSLYCVFSITSMYWHISVYLLFDLMFERTRKSNALFSLFGSLMIIL